jgi:hypothetical protein
MIVADRTPYMPSHRPRVKSGFPAIYYAKLDETTLRALSVSYVRGNRATVRTRSQQRCPELVDSGSRGTDEVAFQRFAFGPARAYSAYMLMGRPKPSIF